MKTVVDLLRDPVVQATLHGSVALLLAAGAIHKFREPQGFRGALSAYALVPARVEGAAARSIPAAEALLAVLLLIPGTGAGPALAAGGLLAVYAGAMALLLLRGRDDVDCGCGLGPGPQPVRWTLVVRNGALALAAGAASLPATLRPVGWIDGLDVIMALAVTALLLAGFEQAVRNTRRAADPAATRSAV